MGSGIAWQRPIVVVAERLPAGVVEQQGQSRSAHSMPQAWPHPPQLEVLWMGIQQPQPQLHRK